MSVCKFKVQATKHHHYYCYTYGSPIGLVYTLPPVGWFPHSSLTVPRQSAILRGPPRNVCVFPVCFAVHVLILVHISFLPINQLVFMRFRRPWAAWDVGQTPGYVRSLPLAVIRDSLFAASMRSRCALATSRCLTKDIPRRNTRATYIDALAPSCSIPFHFARTFAHAVRNVVATCIPTTTPTRVSCKL